MRTIRGVLLAAVVLLILAVTLVWFVYRPWALNWGSTDDEIARAMPGDSLLSDPTFNATRAVTINAMPEHIWPWIVQIGYRRAGFYSYDRLDNDGIPSAERVIPEYQDLQVGDSVPLSKYSYVRVAALEPYRSMLLVFETTGDWAEATWAWGIYPDGARQTRLVTRLRAQPPTMRARMMLDLLEIVMMRKCMLGIKRRAETLAQVP